MNSPAAAPKDILFRDIMLNGTLKLANRVAMAPMTRSMADDALVPTDAMAEYYGRRADVGLIITEATVISPLAQGYPNTPGLYNQAQIAGWQKVTRKVHDHGGKIFAQLWHTGRVSHPVYLNGERPIAPSAVALQGRVPRGGGLVYGLPRAMEEAEIDQVIAQFARAATNARKAGFDGVELHGANGYLLDQFLHWQTNRRSDDWGGSPENMTRLLFAVIEAVMQEIDHVGVRLSPQAYLHIEEDERDKAVFDYLLPYLNSYQLAYLHAGIYEDAYQPQLKATVTQYLRNHYKGVVIANGGYDAERARQLLRKGEADLVAIGRPLIANPDYMSKIRHQQALVEYHVDQLDTLY